jgi:hypothetical protein
MTLKRIAGVGIAVTAIAATILTTITQPAPAEELPQPGFRLTFGIGGFHVGTAIGTPPPFHRNHPTHDAIYDRERAWDAHVERCYERFLTYDERTDTFVGIEGGQQYCRL